MLNRSPLSVVLDDIRDERRADVPYPPGQTRFSLPRTRRFAEEPLEMLLESYERFGPVFTLRLLHSNVVFMLGPAANHYMLVSHASNFLWREGHFRDLIGLMGDGLLTIDGDFHRSSRRIMLPAFHREHLEASVETVLEESGYTDALRLDKGPTSQTRLENLKELVQSMAPSTRWRPIWSTCRWSWTWTAARATTPSRS